MDCSLSRAIAHVEALLESPRERALAALIEEANKHGADPICKRATMGFPPACIPACLYILMTTDGFEEALLEVINLGGDADSAGAILGALAGAHYGYDAIPHRWLLGLQNREAIDERAHATHQRSTVGRNIPDLIDTEHDLSAAKGPVARAFGPFAERRPRRTFGARCSRIGNDRSLPIILATA